MTIPFTNNVAYPYPMRRLKGIVEVKNHGRKTCVHRYEQCGFHEGMCNNIRVSYRHYKCQTCDRVVIFLFYTSDASDE